MGQPEKKAKSGWFSLALKESPFFFGALTLALFYFGGDRIIHDLSDPLVALSLFVLLFVVMVWGAFGVVRHADKLAEILGEPYGTLILTFSVIGIEVALISAVMLSGDAAPTLARDTMYAVLMIVLNGLVGLALLIGGLRHGEQDYSLQGARSFLAVLVPLAVISLILPKYTISTEAPTFSPLQEGFFATIAILLYSVFLGVQTVRHRNYFLEPIVLTEEPEPDVPKRGMKTTLVAGLLLLLTLLPIVMLSERMAELVDFGLVEVSAPIGLGGVIIAFMVLAPEGLAALKAASNNHLQRSVNLLLGSALATIGLTVPAVLLISLVIGQPVTLGLDNASMILLILTLFMSALTFGGVRTSILQGAVHLVLFLAFLMLIFSP